MTLAGTLKDEAGRNTTEKNDAGSTLKRQNAEILKQIFPEKEYRGLSPNFHIHASVSYLYECGNWG
jgi:hypothetical protein